MEGIWVRVEDCDVEEFRNFCKFWSEIVEVRSSEPPGALGVPGLGEFFLGVASSLTAGGIVWLVPFLLDWKDRNAGNVVSIKIGEEEIVIKGRNIKEIETDIVRIKFSRGD